MWYRNTENSTLWILYNLVSNKELKKFEDAENLQVAVNSKYLWFRDSKESAKLIVFNLDSNKEVKQFNNVGDCQISVTDDYLLYRDSRNSINWIVFDLESNKEVKQFTNVENLYISTNGKYLWYNNADNRRNWEAYDLDPESNTKIKLSLIEHLSHYIHNSTEKDIVDLIDLQKDVRLFPKEMQEPVTKILKNIIEKAGKESGLVEITEENKPDSKDIEVVL